jgi:hypothetical protein
MAERFEAHGDPPQPAPALVFAIAGALVLALIVATVLRSGEAPGNGVGGSAGGGNVKAAPPINTAFQGLTTFRGNASRSYYGTGPVPRDPTVVWRSPPTTRCA